MCGVIVHEWISRTGGSEKVLDAMVEAIPNAPVLCLWNDAPEIRYIGRTVYESWLARTPLRRAKAVALPFMPYAWRNCKPGGYEWALISSHLFAHHVTFAEQDSDFQKFVYVHSPARYIWNPELDERGNRLLPRLVSPALRKLDHKRAQEGHLLAANSDYVRQRIRQAWARDAVVIHPPVNVSRIQALDSWADKLSEEERSVLDRIPRPFVMGASRFIPYKRLDLVIRAGESVQLPVVLAGSGPERRRLLEQARDANVPVTFVDHPSDALLFALYEAALVFVFPAIEDFGIMPVEAMAVGTPVVGRIIGGVSETVINGVTGSLIEDFTSRQSLMAGVGAAVEASPAGCRERARSFDVEHFSDNLRSWIGLSSTSSANADHDSATRIDIPQAADDFRRTVN